MLEALDVRCYIGIAWKSTLIDAGSVYVEPVVRDVWIGGCGSLFGFVSRVWSWLLWWYLSGGYNRGCEMVQHHDYSLGGYKMGGPWILEPLRWKKYRQGFGLKRVEHIVLGCATMLIF